MLRGYGATLEARHSILLAAVLSREMRAHRCAPSASLPEPFGAHALRNERVARSFRFGIALLCLDARSELNIEFVSG
jgi:hypothetical protein